MKKYVAGRVLFMSKGVALASVVMMLSSFTRFLKYDNRCGIQVN